MPRDALPSRETLDPLRPLDRFTWVLMLGIVGIAIVTLSGFAVAGSPGWTRGELGVLQGLSHGHVAPLDVVAVAIAVAFAPTGGLLVSAALTLVVAAATRDAARTLTFALTIAVCWGSSEALKHVVRRVRPDVLELANPPDVLHTFSYPSGHTAFAAALGVAFLLLLRDHRLRLLAGWLAVALVALVAWSRMYLGVHYPTDTLAAVVLVASAGAAFTSVWLRFVMPAAVVPAPWLRAQRWR